MRFKENIDSVETAEAESFTNAFQKNEDTQQFNVKKSRCNKE